MSAATAKRGLDDPQREPRSGTQLRAVYEAFVANPGVPIVPPVGRKRRDPLGPMIIQLNDFYGMDIRVFRHRGVPGTTRVPSEYVLVGRWRGSRYEDYVQGKAP